MTSQDLVLITGGSGFQAAHCIIAALRDNFRVRTTVRSLNRKDDVLKMLEVGGVPNTQRATVEFAVADLMSDEGWADACEGCAYVLHVASPLPMNAPKHPDDLIVPARDGTLRVLKVAKEAGVRRVVVTGSFGAIGAGHNQREEPFTEDDWTNLENPNSPVIAYHQSKTIAERAAWDWLAADGGSMELTFINPVAILGPILSPSAPTSIQVIARLLNGAMPGLPQITLGAVDARDVADLHLLAMVHRDASGQRFIAISDNGVLSLKAIAEMTRDVVAGKGDAARAARVPMRVMPNFVMRFLGLFDQGVAFIVPDLGKRKGASSEKAKRVLGWKPRSMEDAVKATAESLEHFGLLT